MGKTTATIERNEKAAEVVNDLILINNDRMEGYQRALEETKDADSDLKALFVSMQQESSQLKADLTNIVRQLDEEPAEGTRTDGKIYRAWMDVKATFSGNSRKAVLENCEFGEDAAQKAYKDALAENGLPADIREVIKTQQAKLKASHDKIKQLRDKH